MTDKLHDTRIVLKELAVRLDLLGADIAKAIETIDAAIEKGPLDPSASSGGQPRPSPTPVPV